MSKSAFGVDHGEVSKAFTMPKPKMPGAGAGKRMGQRKPGMSTTPGGKHAGSSFLKPKTQPGMSRTADTLNRVGQAAQQQPKVAGGIIGGTSLGLTGGVYANRKQKGF